MGTNYGLSPMAKTVLEHVRELLGERTFKVKEAGGLFISAGCELSLKQIENQMYSLVRKGFLSSCGDEGYRLAENPPPAIPSEGRPAEKAAAPYPDFLRMEPAAVMAILRAGEEVDWVILRERCCASLDKAIDYFELIERKD